LANTPDPHSANAAGRARRRQPLRPRYGLLPEKNPPRPRPFGQLAGQSLGFEDEERSLALPL
jgi:hypothetical protein